MCWWLRRSSLTTIVEQAALGYRYGFFKPETVDFMIREHEGKTNGTGTLTAVSPGTHHCEPAWHSNHQGQPVFLHFFCTLQHGSNPPS